MCDFLNERRCIVLVFFCVDVLDNAQGMAGKQQRALTPEELRTWRASPLINPRTGRAISKTGSVYREIEKQARQDEEDANNDNSSSNDTRRREKEMISSAPLLRDVPRVLERQEGGEMSPVCRALVRQHVDRALHSYDNPFPINTFRNLETADIPRPFKYATLERSPTLRKLTITNCHDGQRKLAMALLEFVASGLLRLGCAPEDVLLVYAGASGLAGAIASSVFPGLRMVLYDPAPNTLSHMPGSFKGKAVFTDTFRVDPSSYASKRLAIFTEKAGWFGDDAARFCRDVVAPYFKKRHVFFTSDVRSERGELDVARDMHDQMRWTMLTGCSAYMHKFRLPYMDSADTPRVLRVYNDLSDMPADLFAYHRRREGDQPQLQEQKTTTVPYLDGQLHVQLYARQRTDELRLVGFRDEDGKFAVRDYSVQSVEDKMATFNTIYRSHARFASPHFTAAKTSCEGKKENDVYVLPASYEVVAEDDIVFSCARANGLHDEADIAKVHDIVCSMMATFTHKEPFVCSLVSAATEMKKRGLRVEEYAPHVLQWAADILRVRPNAAIPADFKRKAAARLMTEGDFV